ncbi:MAG: ABC transporter ATP-binding protein [Candidatus Methanomethylophilaceae archaeon]|nr:ABC transporter ATP-binding protein [Candidatus Methanomethylophilaceae archaeon]
MRLEICNLNFSYSTVPVLKDISLTFEGSKLISILGPNGVGKSTLIHCMNKILTPTGGTVKLNGTDITEMPVKELAKIIGYVPYSATDTFPLSVTDTVLIGRHPHSKWRITDDDLDIVFNILRMLKIDDLAMKPFNELSAGQRQKVALARGLAQEPRILLLDEPTSNLDIKHQIDVAMMLKSLSREKDMQTVMISHDINIAAKYSDEIALMHNGSIFAYGSPAEVVTKENLETVYGVQCDIVDDGGNPHVILKGPMDTGHCLNCDIRLAECTVPDHCDAADATSQ